MGTEDVLKPGGTSGDLVNVVACPLCNKQIYSGKIRKNTTENFYRKVEEGHDMMRSTSVQLNNHINQGLQEVLAGHN